MKLTKSMLATLTIGERQRERIVWDAEVRGLGFRMRASGGRTWVIRPPRSGGASRLHTLAPAGAIDLATARRLALEKIAEAALGRDPTKAKREAREQAVLTFGSLIDRYVADKEAKGRRPSTIANLSNHLERHWRPLHSRPLNSISQREVADRHEEIARDYGPHAADRARSILSTFYSWAMAKGLSERNPVVNTQAAVVPTRRDRVLSDIELAYVWHSTVAGDFSEIVRLLILTGQRRDEVGGMNWREITDDRWRLPKDRAKNGREHDVPLSPAALAILRTRHRHDGRDLVFGSGAGPFQGWSNAKEKLDTRVLAALKDRHGSQATLTPWRLHDIRRTVATRMADLGVLPHVIEAVLNHVSGHRGGVAGTYNRSSYAAEKRAALDLWGAHVERLTGEIAPIS